MESIIIFGGTTEGRKLAEVLSCAEVIVHVCVATQYGEIILPERNNIIVHSGRLDFDEMKNLIKSINPAFVIDATHPFARVVTENILMCCNSLDLSYIRLIRDENQMTEEDNIVYVSDIDEAIRYLQDTKGKIFITTGSKELHKFTQINNYKERCYARVLSTVDVVKECKEIGFEGKNISFMQGPFSEEFNYAQIKMIDAKYVVTKSSGANGGFLEKCNAAIKAGCTLIVINRPDDNIPEDLKMNFNEVELLLRNRFKFNVDVNKEVALIGIGMGNSSTITKEASEFLSDCDLLIGAKRIVESCHELVSNKINSKYSYKPEEIVKFIEEENSAQKIAVVFSGDIGFYSGAKNLYSYLNKYNLKLMSGISSPIYFLNKIGKAWEDTTLLSNHGKDINIISKVRTYRKIFMLLGTESAVSEICEKMCKFGMENVDITVGECLSYDNENIVSGKAKDFINKKFNKLSVIFIENDMAEEFKSFGISDEDFKRGKVPMTKCEIRALSLEKLKLKKDSVLYDIGAGTGSVSIEASLYCQDGKVYAIEKNEEGIQLIFENAIKFKVDNCIPILGEASNCIKDLEPPTHVFIGGSSGNILNILKEVKLKNKNAKLVFNAITLETITEIFNLIKAGILVNSEIVQANISKSKTLGNYHMMTANNPIFIISSELGDCI